MSTPTTRLGLVKPATSDSYVIHTDLGNALDALDAAAIADQGPIGSIPSATTKPYGYWYADTAVGGRVWVNVGTGGSRSFRSLATGAEVDAHIANSTAHGNALGGLTAMPLQGGVVQGGEMTRLSSSTVRVGPGSGWLLGLSGDMRWCTWAQTDLTIPATATNSRVDLLSLSLPTTHGDVVTVSRSVLVAEAPGVNLGASDTSNGQTYLGVVLATTVGVGAPSALRDRRRWARGAHFTTRTVGSGAITTTSPGALANAAAQARVELSGNLPAVVRFVGLVRSATSGREAGVSLMMDGAALVSSSATAGGTAPNQPLSVEYPIESAVPGTHLFQLYGFYDGTGSATVLSGMFAVEERLQLTNSYNGTT